MMSKKLFDQLEFICRQLKNKSLIFGGMQVIAVGDFFQSAPVPDGENCFKSLTFVQLFSHKFVLADVLRQQQPDFVQAVNDVAKGDIPETTHNLLRRLQRPLQPGDDPIKLSARIFYCFIYNACKLMDTPGEEHVFHSIDTGNIEKLNNVPVPKSLHIKVGCSVMLLNNLSDQLVNGLRGIVSCVSEEAIGVVLKIPNSEKTLYSYIRRDVFFKFIAICMTK